MQMVAVIEAALSTVGHKFNEPFFYIAKIQVVQAEFLHAGAIDQMAVCIQVV